MDKAISARELRAVPLDHGELPKPVLDLLPDDDIVDCFTRCCRCGRKHFGATSLDEMVYTSLTVDVFLSSLSARSRSRRPARDRDCGQLVDLNASYHFSGDECTGVATMALLVLSVAGFAWAVWGYLVVLRAA